MTQNADPDRRDRGTPETLRLQSISVAITVDDIQTSLRWYCDVVGFHLEETYEHEGEVRGASLVAGAQRMVISQDDGAKGDRVKGQGFRIYLKASTDVDGVAAAIKDRGGVLATEPTDMPWGARAFNLVDPDGFQLTISS